MDRTRRVREVHRAEHRGASHGVALAEVSAARSSHAVAHLRDAGAISRALTQNGVTSRLEVLTKNLAISGAYTLTAGTAPTEPRNARSKTEVSDTI